MSLQSSTRRIQPSSSSAIYSHRIELKIKLNKLHAVSRIQQGRQRDHSVDTLRSPRIIKTNIYLFNYTAVSVAILFKNIGKKTDN